MEQREKVRMDDTKRLLQWIRNNPNQWIEIKWAITEEDVLQEQEFKEVILNLKNNGFYQLLVLLLYTNNNSIKKALEKTILDVICKQWNDNSIDNMVDMLIDNIN